MNRVAVVVLTWNHRQYTMECLRSLERQRMPHRVYVVDNASTDNTPRVIGAAFPEARIVVNEENLGFAAGNNIGLAMAFDEGAETVLILNNDTTLDEDMLMHLVEATHTHEDVGILSPLILFAQPPHHVWFAGAKISAWSGQDNHVEYDKEFATAHIGMRQIERATGCAMLITRQCYQRLGGFDPDLFMYFEDVEYSLRARNAGFQILLLPQAVVYHHVSVSTGGSKSPTGIYYMLRNSIVVMERYYPAGRLATAVRRIVMLLVMIRFILVKPRAIRRFGDVIAAFRDARRRRLGRRLMALPPSPQTR